MAASWSKYEVDLIVENYFAMLRLELSGLNYSKASNRRALLSKLNNRSEGSIEFKHQNISAILVKYGLPYIFGYKPRHNYQSLLEEIVLISLSESVVLTSLFENFTNQSTSIDNKKLDYSNLLVDPPKTNVLNDEPAAYNKSIFKKVNYLELEQQNTALGEQGEQLILNYERWKLINAGKEKLADTIEWVSKEKGDGAGFDILSKNLNGKDMYIEVKTTKLGDAVPIHFTRNEWGFSQKNNSDFFLYRVFNFQKDPKFFIKEGSFDRYCNIEPTKYIGRF